MPRKAYVDPADAVIGREIQRLRQIHRMSQELLAYGIGVEANFVSDIEAGRRSARKHIAAIADVFDVPASFFTHLIAPCPRCQGCGLVATEKITLAAFRPRPRREVPVAKPRPVAVAPPERSIDPGHLGLRRPL